MSKPSLSYKSQMRRKMYENREYKCPLCKTKFVVYIPKKTIYVECINCGAILV